MRVLYLSSGPRHRVLEAIVAAGHQVATVIATPPADTPRVRPSLEFAEEHSIPIRVLRNRREFEQLPQLVHNEVLLSVGFAWILPASVLDAAALCLNVHGTLLPCFAGARTLNWVIASGASRSGVTVHKMVPEVDAGPVLLQRSFEISKFDTVVSLQRKTLEFEPAVVIEALRAIESGNVTYEEQVTGGVRRWPDRVPSHSEIDPSKPLVELFDTIRAADAVRFPAYFVVDGERVAVRLERLNKPQGEEDMI